MSRSYYSDYGYKGPEDGLSNIDRPEYGYIEEWVSEGAKVLDLGCGEGSLLKRLADKKKVYCYGVEISEDGVRQCKAKGLPVQLGDVDEGLGQFGDKSFDYVIMNVTLQMVYRPDFVLREMLRVGKKAIVSFPNFAFWYGRLELMFWGVMPKKQLFGYEWYNTRHIHQLSIKDFKNYCRKIGAEILKEVYFGVHATKRSFIASLAPNLLSREGIFLVAADLFR